jgi:hypothetical protein
MMAQDGSTTTATTPHVLDVWKNTILVSRGIIPYCTSDSDCVERFREAFVVDNTTTTTTAQGHAQLEMLSKVIYCYSGVRVPEYYENAVQHATGGNNSLATPFFESKVCTCDQSALFRGVRCEPNEYGMMLQGLFCLIGLWILGLLLRVIKLSFTSRHLTSKTNQMLRATALLQYAAQLAWIAGTIQFRSFIGNPAVSDLLVVFGFDVCMFAGFVFATGMLLQTTAYLRGTMHKVAERKQKSNLRRASWVFTALPFAVLAASTFLFIAKKLSIITMINSTAAIVLTAAFTVIARMLDKRIRRLLPRSEGHSGEGQRRAAAAVPMDDSVRSLLESSRKIRTMTKALRNATARNVLAIVLYLACRLFADTPRRWLVPLLFCVVQVSLAHVPMIGVAGLSATFSIKTNIFNIRRVVPTRGGLKLAPELQQTSAAESSSDCGTLGGS